MAALERVMNLKSQGKPESQIIAQLKQEGYTPKDINEAISQSTIKSALENEKMVEQNNEEGFPEGMQPSIMSQPTQQVESEETNPEPVQEPYSPYEQNYQNPPYQDYGYSEYQGPQSTDIETLNDLAEQIVDEKLVKIKEELSAFISFRDEAILQVQRINKRLNHLEESFNNLQMAILKRVGEYGQDMKDIKKEMNMTQESVSKLLNPLTDNLRELQKIAKAK